ncbi:MAG: HAMP domain-containing protein [Proteobacteria bacterium]|nr:HAMP domain-containing protein [Pseudomonadota bacterium]MBU1450924.1 HAMP domain-containing protein [Pseudomonadota bacterium]MBU2468215.1 HAMP domain-containing protein [Pseudomonadota bacterium]MBU2518361.1 HAMP domain-containing protein [Pseudomonadota bacterium]
MTRAKRLFLANLMLLGNLLANLMGVALMAALDRWAYMIRLPRTPEIMWLIIIYDLFAFTVGIGVLLTWERPIRRHLADLAQGRQSSPALKEQARRRLLNEPWVAVGLNLFLWGLATLVFPLVLSRLPVLFHLTGVMALRSLFVGAITVATAFFLLEHLLQHLLAPVFFPGGGLSRVRGAWRIRIGYRMAGLLLGACMIPFLAIIFTIRGSARLVQEGAMPPAEVLGDLQAAVVVLCLLFMVNAVGLASLVTVNMVRPLREIVRGLSKVRGGDFGSRVQVMANDEIGYTADMINQMTEGLAERERIKDAFGLYVSQQVRDEILAGRIPLDGEIKQVTMLFSDLRDFTPLVEATPPKEVVVVINGYFQHMAAAVEEHGGLVLQYIGDEIEAVFGAPLALADHPRHAVEAARAMRRRLAAYNARLIATGHSPLRHGIGIHSGPALAANIGGGGRLSYALVGDTVNLAARLQDMTKVTGRDILVSGTTAAALGQGVALERISATMVKGRSQPVEIFAVP